MCKGELWEVEGPGVFHRLNGVLELMGCSRRSPLCGNNFGFSMSTVMSLPSWSETGHWGVKVIHINDNNFHLHSPPALQLPASINSSYCWVSSPDTLALWEEQRFLSLLAGNSNHFNTLLLVCWGSHNKVPQTGWLKQWSIISPSSGGWEG